MAQKYELDVKSTTSKFPSKSRKEFTAMCKGVKDDTFFGDANWNGKNQLNIKLSQENLNKIKSNLNVTIKKDNKYELDGIVIKFLTSSKVRSSNKKPSASSKTALAESAVCIATAFLLQKNRDLTIDDLENKKSIEYITTKINDIVDIGELDSKKGIKEVLGFLANDETWLTTSVQTASILKEKLKLGKNHHFHRDSMFMNNIYKQALKHIKILNKVGLRIGGDKWNPGDIWIAKGSNNKGFSAKKDLTELNAAVLKKFNDADIMGVSLKKLGKSPTYSIYNLENQERNFFFKEVKKPAGDLMDSKDMYIVTQKGRELQIRTFDTNSDIQVEIKGSSAAGGKAGFGLVSHAIKKIANEDILSRHEINKMTEDSKIKLIRKLYTSSFGDSAPLKNKILDTVNSKKNRVGKSYKSWSNAAQNDYWSSKIQALQICSVIKNSKKQDDIMTIIVSYAASLGMKDMFDASVYAKVY